MLLSVWPCGDAEAFTINAKENLVASGSEKQTDEECSPMCACMCCRVVMEDVKLKELTILTPQLAIAKPQFSYVESLLAVHLDIWQPPKLG